MGFLLGLEHASLTKMSPRCCSKNANSNHPTVRKNSGKLDVQTDNSKNMISENKTSIKKTKEQGYQLRDTQVATHPWKKEDQETDIQCLSQHQFYDDCRVDEKSNDIRQCLKRTLSNLNTKWHSNEKLSLVKINKATSEVVTGVRYTIDFDARDEITGRSYSTEAIIISQPWNSEDPAIVDFRCSPRASI